VRIVGSDFSFSPNQVRIAAGSTVSLVLVNDGDLPHDVTIPALGFRLSTAPGAKASGSLTVTRAGSYELYCAVPGHREAGMSGMLIAT
jgi:nitrite reductase (NO-forming)